MPGAWFICSGKTATIGRRRKPTQHIPQHTPHTNQTHHTTNTAHRTMHTLHSPLAGLLCRCASSNPISTSTSPTDSCSLSCPRSPHHSPHLSTHHFSSFPEYPCTVQPGVAIKDNKTAEGVDNTIARFMAWRARGTS